VILPTHRLVHSYARMTGRQALATLEQEGLFRVEPAPDRAAVSAALAEAAAAGQTRYGFYDGQHAVLTLRATEAMDALAPDHTPAWRALDVSVLHRVVLERVMGLSQDSIARQENIRYLRDANAGYAAVDAAGGFLFVLNPTRMGQVRACAEAGEPMPQKSTDFYPKMLSGWVSMPLTGEIEI